MDNKDNNSQDSNMMGGGIFIVIGLLIGIAVGIWQGQISLGLITGFAFGVVAAIALWLFDRNKNSGK